MSDETCRVCGSKKSEHVPTDLGPFTCPRVASGEGNYRCVARGTIGGWLRHDDMPYERWEFVPAKPLPITESERRARREP